MNTPSKPKLDPLSAALLTAFEERLAELETLFTAFAGLPEQLERLSHLETSLISSLNASQELLGTLSKHSNGFARLEEQLTSCAKQLDVGSTLREEVRNLRKDTETAKHQLSEVHKQQEMLLTQYGRLSSMLRQFRDFAA